MPYKTSSYNKEYERLIPVFGKATEKQLRHADHLLGLIKTQDVAHSFYEHKFMSRALSVYIGIQAANGEIQAKDDVDVIIPELQFLYQRYMPEGTRGAFGLPLKLQLAAMVTLGNMGNMVPIFQGEVKEDLQEALDSLLKRLRSFTKKFADMMVEKAQMEEGQK